MLIETKGNAMEELYSIPLSNVIKEFKLETLHLPNLPENIQISCPRVSRPGLQMAGFYDYYEPARIQIIGKMEHSYLAKLREEEKLERLETFFGSSPIAVIVTSSSVVDDKTIAMAEKHSVPLLRTADRTSEFMAALIA